jgi:hypothetical protein
MSIPFRKNPWGLWRWPLPLKSAGGWDKLPFTISMLIQVLILKDSPYSRRIPEAPNDVVVYHASGAAFDS